MKKSLIVLAILVLAFLLWRRSRGVRPSAPVDTTSFPGPTLTLEILDSAYL